MSSSQPSETCPDSLYLSPIAWFGITFATFWIALLGHEAAHFAIAHFVYSRSELSGGDVAPRHGLLVVGAGPAFTLAMMVACAAASRSHRSAASAFAKAPADRHSLGGGWSRLAQAPGTALGQVRAIAIAAIAFGVSRLVVIAPATLLNWGGNDERTVANFLNMSPVALWIAEALVAVAAVAFVARGQVLAHARQSLTAIAAAIVAGWSSAITVGRAIGLPI